MKYRLKDRELQAKLEAIEPEFSVVMSYSCGNGGSDAYVILLPSKGVEMTIKISKSALEEAHEFDPKAWNKWPEVLPPEDVKMRVEYLDNTGEHYTSGRFAVINGDGSWSFDGRSFTEQRYYKFRFRPWEDPE